MSGADRSESVVHVVDDDEPLRTAVSRLLRAAGYKVLTFASAGEFALTYRAGDAGCILLDVRMPGPSGLDLQRSLNGHGSRLPVVFLTGHADVQMAVQAMKAGAIDVLTKPVEKERLFSAVRAAMEQDALARQRRSRIGELQDRFSHLTDREREVFKRVVAGEPNKQIAYDSSISERTVKAHRAEVMRKMGASSLAELVHIADELSGLPEVSQ